MLNGYGFLCYFKGKLDLLIISMHIDPFSIIVFTIIISLMMSAGLFVVSRNYLTDVKGICYWAKALFLMGIGWSLTALYGIIPHFFSMIIGTALALIAIVLYFRALAEFKEIKVSLRWLYIVVTISFLAHIYFVLINFNIAAKIVVTSLSVAVLLLANSILLLTKQHTTRPRSHQVTAAFFGFASGVYVIRAFYYLIWNTQPEQFLFQHNIIQDLAYLTNAVFIVGTTFGFGLMCNEKYFDEKNQAQLELNKSVSLLNATLESTADALLVISSTGDVVQYNSLFVKMWGISESAPELRSNPFLLVCILDQVIDKEGFLNDMIDIDSRVYDENFSEVHFKDGRIIECYSKPHYLNGKPVGRVWSFRDVTERKAAEEEIKQLAFYDWLTGLPNRRKLFDRLSYSIALSQRPNTQFAVFMIDLDKFKAVNDSLGHTLGDELLKQVAIRIRNCLRDGDMVARLGGDEFILILENLKIPEAAEVIALKLITELTIPFQLSENARVQIGASIGISIYPQHGTTPEILMDHADIALYQAKENGRGCFSYFTGNF